MANLEIALLQIASCGMDQRANLLKGEDYCRRAAGLRAWREKEAVRNQQRKPRLYRLISSISACGDDGEPPASRDE